MVPHSASALEIDCGPVLCVPGLQRSLNALPQTFNLDLSLLLLAENHWQQQPCAVVAVESQLLHGGHETLVGAEHSVVCSPGNAPHRARSVCAGAVAEVELRRARRHDVARRVSHRAAELVSLGKVSRAVGRRSSSARRATGSRSRRRTIGQETAIRHRAGKVCPSLS